MCNAGLRVIKALTRSMSLVSIACLSCPISSGSCCTEIRYVTEDVFCLNLPAERMENDLATSHDEGVGDRFVNIVGCLGAPENVGVVAVNAP